MRRRVGETRHLLAPIGETRNVVRRVGEGARPARQRRGGDPAEIAASDAGSLLDQFGAAAEQQIAAAEDAALRSHLEMMHEQIEPGPPVGADHLRGHRDEFCGARAGAGTGGEERDMPGPADIHEVRKGGLPIIRPEIFIAPQRHGRLKGAMIGEAREIVVAAEARRRGAADQPLQCSLLYRGGILARETRRAKCRVETQEGCGVDHRRIGSSIVRCGKLARAVAGSSGTVMCSPRRNSSVWSRKAGLPGTPSCPPSSTRRLLSRSDRSNTYRALLPYATAWRPVTSPCADLNTVSLLPGHGQSTKRKRRPIAGIAPNGFASRSRCAAPQSRSRTKAGRAAAYACCTAVLNRSGGSASSSCASRRRPCHTALYKARRPGGRTDRSRCASTSSKASAPGDAASYLPSQARNASSIASSPDRAQSRSHKASANGSATSRCNTASSPKAIFSCSRRSAVIRSARSFGEKNQPNGISYAVVCLI